ncbi:hypothetical protein [Desulfobotulus alkaliphilus]|uniref:hypothetical protein n=1 Tax=Desulfobotulus alkaliphilus TaxID=622671 RepID=UPI0011A821D1|nr:hypothetical protein [Desulfobotulus alkaliphilus]
MRIWYRIRGLKRLILSLSAPDHVRRIAGNFFDMKIRFKKLKLPIKQSFNGIGKLFELFLGHIENPQTQNDSYTFLLLRLDVRTRLIYMPVTVAKKRGGQIIISSMGHYIRNSPDWSQLFQGFMV